MKKWILLILAYGMVFSPAALAVDQDQVQAFRERWAAQAKWASDESGSTAVAVTGEAENPNPAGSFCKSMYASFRKHPTRSFGGSTGSSSGPATASLAK